jgi:phosphoglucosamine mutase
LQVLAVLVEEGRPASESCRVFQPLPQVLKSVRFSGPSPLEAAAVRAAVAQAEAELAATGRLLIRKSGTEPVVRVMAEGEDSAMVRRIVDDLCAEIAAAAEPVGQAAE